MNEHHLPPDELASAFLDGELDSADGAAVRDDPELAARAEALRAAAEAVGEPVTPPLGTEDAAVAAALADFDARQATPLDTSRRQSRNLRVITSVAAAVAIGFIVAAAIGLFAETGSDEEAADAAPAIVAATEDAAAPAPEPPPPPAAAEVAPAAAEPEAALAAPAPAPPDLEDIQASVAEAREAADAAMAAAELAQAVAEGNEASVAAAEVELAEAQAAADEAMAEAAAAQAEAAAAQSEAAAAQEAQAARAQDAEAARAQAQAAADEAIAEAAAAQAEAEALAGMDVSPAERCADAIVARAIELQFTAGAAPVVVLRASDGSLAALDGATCAELPAGDATEMTSDPTPEDCAAAAGATTIELQITIGDIAVIVVTGPDGGLDALDGRTCEVLAPSEPSENTER